MRIEIRFVWFVWFVVRLADWGIGGGGGIRTPGGLAASVVFKTTAFNHSATPPRGVIMGRVAWRVKESEAIGDVSDLVSEGKMGFT